MEIEIKQVPPLSVISRRERLTIPQIPSRSGPAIQSLIEMLSRVGVPPAGGEMIYIYHGCNGDPTLEFELEICLPVPAGLSPLVPLGPPIELKTIRPFRCAAIDYVGPMSGIGQAWMELVRHIRKTGHNPTDESREIYEEWIGFDSPDNVTELQQGVAEKVTSINNPFGKLKK